MSNIAENPLIMGAAASGLLWLVQKFRKEIEGPTITWLMAVMALGLALVEQIWILRMSDTAIQSMVIELSEFLSTLPAVVSPLVRDAGAIFLSAQVVYRSLQSKLMGRAIYKSAKILEYSVSGYVYFAETYLLEEDHG